MATKYLGETSLRGLIGMIKEALNLKADTGHTHSNYVQNNANQTITCSSGNTALQLKSKATSSYIGFQNSSGAQLGSFGFDANKTPIAFIDDTANTLAIADGIKKIKISSDIPTVDDKSVLTIVLKPQG